MSNYWQKKLDELNQSTKKSTKTSSNSSKKKKNYWEQKMDELEASQKKKDEDIAPVKTTTKTNDSGYFTKGAMEEGFSWKNLWNTITGTSADVKEHAISGGVEGGESLWDALLGIGADIVSGELRQFNNYANISAVKDEKAHKENEKVIKQIKTETAAEIVKDKWNGEKVAQNILGSVGYDPEKYQKNSVLGDKSDALVESGGRLLVSQAPNLIYPGAGLAVSGLMAYGGEMEGALKAGASFEDAATSATVTAVGEMATELISGGISFGHGTLDDFITDGIAKNITSKTARHLLNLGVDIAGEGGEEILSGYISAIGQQMTYMEEYELNELFSSEDMLDSFIGGAVLGGFGSAGKAVVGNIKGVDSVTNLTKSEQKVLDTEFNNRVAEAEKGGKKLTAKEKSEIYNEAFTALERGEISTDTIESVLGGEDYKRYKTETERQEALKKELDELRNTPKGQLTDIQSERMEFLKTHPTNPEMLNTLKSSIDEKIRAELDTDSKRLGKNRGSFLVESYNEKARKNQSFNADLSKYKSAAAKQTVQNAIESGKKGLIYDARDAHDFVDLAARISEDKGYVVEFITSKGLQKQIEEGNPYEIDADPNKIDAFVSEKHQRIFVNLDAKKSLNSLVGHEITDTLRKASAFDALKEVAIEVAKAKGEYDSRLESTQRRYKNIKSADIEGEMVSDIVGDYLFTDYDFIRNLSANNRNIFQQIWDDVKYLYKMATAGSKEARQLETLKHNFEKAYRETSKTEANAEAQKNTAENGGANATLYGITKTSKIPYNDQVKLIEDGKLNGSNSLYIGKPSEQLQTVGFSDAPFAMNQSDYRKSRRESAKNKNYSSHAVPYDFFASMPQYISDSPLLIDNGAKVSVVTSYGMKDTRGKDSYVIAGVLKNQRMESDTINQVKSVYPLDDFAERIKNAAESGKLVVTNKNKAEQMLATIGIQPSEVSRLINLAKGTISQTEADVKTKFSLSDSDGKELSKGQREYFKDSKVRDENGNLKVMYHGTNESFTVFDKKKAKSSGTYGKGFYFTDSDSHAKTYGETLTVYLNITNPLQNGTNDITKEQLRKFVEIIAENEDYGIENYGYGATVDSVVDSVYGKSDFAMLMDLNVSCIGNMVEAVELFNEVNGTDYNGIVAPTETVAFYPEQIKSIDNLNPTSNTDIRYSLTEYTEEEKKAHNTAVVEHFGKTFKWAETGYLLLDGTRLDMSGKHEGAPGGYRTVDHRDIVDALGSDYGDGSYSGALIQFMSEGNIRIIPESNGINLSVKPTKAQETALANFISMYRGEVMLDIDDSNGYTVASVEYPYGTHSSKVLSDIREWFDNGKAPETSNYSLFSLSEEGTPKEYGNFNVYGKNIRYREMPAQEAIAPIEEDLKTPTEEIVPTQEAALPEKLAPIAKQEAKTTAEQTVKQRNRKPSKSALVRYTKKKSNTHFAFNGAYNLDGKQYLSDGIFAAEFNSVDEKLEHNTEFPIKQIRQFLEDAVAKQSEEKYSIDLEKIIEINKANKERVFVNVGGNLYDTKYVEAVMRAIENPIFSISGHRGGFKTLVAVGENGNAMLMPVRAGEKSVAVYEAQQIQTEAESIPSTAEEATAVREASNASLDDAAIPQEPEVPYYDEGQPVSPASPFENRDITKVGNQKVKAYMDENPEVKPFFKAEAEVMLGELRNTTKGERLYNDDVYYESGGESGWSGTKRHTTDDIAYLLDSLRMSYADIENGLNAIIEDGKKNAAAKKIEFLINDRLMNGYTDIDGLDIPANQEYINLLAEKQLGSLAEQAGNTIFETGDQYAPAEENIAPLPEDIAPVENIAPVAEAFEAIRPKQNKEPKLARATSEEQARAEILTEEPETEKKKNRFWSQFMEKFADKGFVFENLSKKTKNRELEAKWNFIRYAEGNAQTFMREGEGGVKSLKSIVDRVEKSGKTKEFYEYLYHQHNVDRMTLAERNLGENKAVFGNTTTAETSRNVAAQLEKANPEFKAIANEVYTYNKHLRQMLVDGGVISQETADLWEAMYPHYVPIRRLGDSGLNINVPLDSGKTGVNAPIKRATGGSRDILPLFDTMAQRTLQTYKAIAKNRFGVELKNTLNSTIAREATNLDGVIESIDSQDGLLQEGKNGRKPTFTVFENGEKVTFEITEDMYDALKPKSEQLAYTNKFLNTFSNLQRNILTQYNPVFMLTNAAKDIQDVLINSQHAAKTYSNVPNAVKEIVTKGKWYTEYMRNGGEQNTYFENESNTFKEDRSGIKKLVGMPLDIISSANDFIEKIPRLAEYIASRKSGRSVEVSMLDAARVTTNFAAGGDVTKFLNRNGATFLNASVQGAMQQVRNVREAKMNGVKGWAVLATKFAFAGLAAEALNHLLWDDDEEYEELSDYVKQNYYVVGKTEDGTFIRIPKGRTVAVIQDAFEQISNAATGDDEVDLKSFLELVVSNLAPNNPIDDNVFAPIMQVTNNKTWYGEDLVPTRLQDLPAAEQFDESTDEFSKWLGENLNFSPYKINYLLDQYSGGVGDVVLPMMTPEAESGDNSLAGNMLAPLKDKFTTDSTMNNQNISDFYDMMDELTANAKSSKATDEDVLKSKFINSVNSELGELYKQKREIQNSDLSASAKYSAVRAIQEQIVSIAKDGLEEYESVSVDGKYAAVGDRHYRLNDDGEWTKITDEQLEKQEEVTRGLGITPGQYWGNRDEYNMKYYYPEKYEVLKEQGISVSEYKDNYEKSAFIYTDDYSWAADNPDKYTLSKAITNDVAKYRKYTSDLYDLKADKDSNGKTIRGSEKEKKAEYIDGLNLDYGQKIILFKSLYEADDTYNYEIVEYLNGRDDITHSEMITILKELGFTVSSDGTVSW